MRIGFDQQPLKSRPIQNHISNRQSQIGYRKPQNGDFKLQIQKRRGWDSNPRYSFPYTAFPVLPVQPLLHLSGLSTKSRGTKWSRELVSRLLFCAPLYALPRFGAYRLLFTMYRSLDLQWA